MHILLSNDDGVMAPGLRELAASLPKGWRITIIAPEHQQSGMSHALTVNRKLTLKTHESLNENINILSFSGTPTDCVKFALEYYLQDDMPDIVIAGINDGFNLGSDAIYSGTIGAAMEGVFYKVPSLAISTAKYTSARGKEIFPFLVEFIEEIFINKKYKGFLNMNFPKKGICTWDNLKVAKQGVQKYKNAIEEIETDDEHSVYVVAGEVDWYNEDKNSDVQYMKDGYITVTALQWQQIDIKEQEQLVQCIDTLKKPQ